MANLKDKLSSEVAGIILRYVKIRKGRLTQMSEDSRINRRELNVQGITQMRLHRLLRLIYALHLELSYAEYMKMTDEIRDKITGYAEDFDYTLLDEW